MSKMHRTSLAAVCALLGLGAGCSDATRSDTQTASDDLSSTEASLAAAEESRDAAREAARECFEAFETCVAADGADVEACRATLAECLPDDAPLPPECGEDGPGRGPGREPPGDGSNQDEDGDDTSDEADGGDGDGDGRGGWGGRDCPEDEGDEPADDGDEPADDGDGDVPADDGDGDVPADDGDDGQVAERRFGGFGGDGPMCERPGLPGGGLAECRQAARDVIEAGGDRDAARAAFEECAEAAFGDFIDGLCDRAEELCSGDDAPAERCEHLADACD
jgi:hypothetical protein